MARFLLSGCKDIFEGWEGLGEVLGKGGGDDFKVCEADLLKQNWLTIV